ncbi:MAG: hypothetical protein Tsb002_19090 [Wenzhouxiangellaceae bacterium]
MIHSGQHKHVLIIYNRLLLAISAAFLIPTMAHSGNDEIILRSGFETIFKDCPDCPNMVIIPGGTFFMGTPDSQPIFPNNERPQHAVSVPPFAIGQTEITFAQWDMCVSHGGCTHIPNDLWGRGEQPVIRVSWQDTLQYLEWLGQKSGFTYRLPSEAEWEYAARAGTQTLYNLGDCITTRQVNFNGKMPLFGCPYGILRQQTLPVASFLPNAFGLYDTHGNVWEWTQDCWNDNYMGAPTDGSAWLTGNCDSAVIRSGAWSAVGASVRSAIRGSSFRNISSPNTGFRVARSISP